MKFGFRSLSVFASLLLASLAQAQGTSTNDYSVAFETKPYQLVTDGVLDTAVKANADNGRTTVNLGFPFTYYGVTYTSLMATTDGLILLDPSGITSCGGSSGCFSNRPVPQSSGSFHGFIAPWWDDGEQQGGTEASELYVRHAPGEVTIEFRNWGYFQTSWSSARYTYSVTLTSSGMVRVHYGPHNSFSSGSATSGFENQTGSAGTTLVTCTTPGSCKNTDWPANREYVFGRPTMADVVVEKVEIDNGAEVAAPGGGTRLEMDLTTVLQNHGMTASGDVTWRAYLSADQTVDPSDTLLYTSTNPQPIAATASFSATQHLTIDPAPAPGTVFYILVEAVSSTAEASTTNNVSSNGRPLSSGLDLEVTSISGPASVGPGSDVTVQVQAGNEGFASDPAAIVEIYLSTDAAYSSNDRLVHSATASLASGESKQLSYTFALTSQLPPGQAYWVARIVASNGTSEGFLDNNTVAATTETTINLPNLALVSVELLDGVTGLPTGTAYFGEPARMRVTYNNNGAVGSPSFEVGMGISVNSQFTLRSDTLACTTVVPAIPANGSATVDFSCTLPLNEKNDPAKPAFTSGGYFLMSSLDPYNFVTETSESDNNGAVQPQTFLRAPAADYAVVEVDAPASSAVGEVIPVFRTIRNLGNRAGEEVRVRFVASANDIITSDDPVLEILTDTGVVADIGLTLGVGEESSATQFVRLPPQIPPGNYYIGILVDEANAVFELDETNNAVASDRMTSLAEGAMRILTDSLPDGIVGASYRYRLAVTGAQGIVTWSVGDGAQDLMSLGLTLSSDGTLSGTPEASAIVAFTAQAVDASGRAAIRRLVVRALPTTSELVITTQTLPPVTAAQNVPYLASVSAAGGVKPYTWSVIAGQLPRAITLAADGTLSGFLSQNFTPREELVTFRVVDAVGSSVERQLKLKIVAPGGLVIDVLSLADGMVGQSYLQDVVAKNASGESLALPLSWEIVAGQLPPGMNFRTPSSDLFLLEGIPQEAGTSRFSLMVRDAAGRADIADFVLFVHAKRLKVEAKQAFVPVARSQEASFELSTDSQDAVTYRLISGTLPRGLELGADGKISGTVGADAQVGVSSFVVEAKDAKGFTGLGAFGIEVMAEPVAAVGCSASGSTSMGWLMLFALPLLFVRRRAAKAVATLAVVAVAAAPALAEAQTVVTYSKAEGSQTFIPLSSGGQLLPDPANTSVKGTVLNLSFPFKFYGTDYTSIGVSQFGYLLLGGGAPGTSTSNYGIPSTSTSSPGIVIAPWWDNLKFLTGQGRVRYYTFPVSNEPPYKRELVIEWTDMQFNNSTTPGGPFSFQVRLYEGSNKIRFNYGLGVSSTGARPPSGSTASVGIQSGANQSNSVAALPCTVAGSTTGGSCKEADYPLNRYIDFVLPADVKATAFRADTTGYGGLTLKGTLDVLNNGGRTAFSMRSGLYLSSDPQLDGSDTMIGQTGGRDVAIGETLKIELTGTVPAGTPEGNYYLFAKADSSQIISEPNETDNVSDPFPVRIAPGTANLQVVSVPTPANSSPGASLSVGRSLYNSGSANAEGTIRYTFLLSDNSAVSLSDRKLATFTLNGLAAGELNEQVDELLLPDDLSPGRYWLGVCADYDPDSVPTSTVQEISEVDNCAGTASGFIVGTSELSIITPSALSDAAQFAPYGERLEAFGGDASYTWSILAGSLPSGLELTPDGRIEGSPGASGAFSFTAQVASGAGSTPQTRDFSITVASAAVSLAVAPQDLSVGEFAQPYRASLIAVGGRPPYVWSLVDGSRLASGLTLSSEGVIEGRPGETGVVPFRVQVRDTTGATAAAQMSVQVVSSSTLSIATSKLNTAFINKEYAQVLQGVGGRPPYRFEVMSFQPLQVTATDPLLPRREKTPENPDVFPPEFGMGVAEVDDFKAVLTGTPATAGTYALRLRLTDDSGTVDETTLVLTVSYDEALQLTTTWLPDAFAGQEYAVKLSSNAKAGVVPTYEIACIQQSDDQREKSDCVEGSGGSLPPGLTLNTDGSIRGTPEDGGSVDSIHSFLVKVSDDKGRQGVRSLSIKLRPAFGAKGGCAGGGAIPSAIALALAAASLLRRRSRR